MINHFYDIITIVMKALAPELEQVTVRRYYTNRYSTTSLAEEIPHDHAFSSVMFDVPLTA